MGDRTRIGETTRGEVIGDPVPIRRIGDADLLTTRVGERSRRGLTTPPRGPFAVLGGLVCREWLRADVDGEPRQLPSAADTIMLLQSEIGNV
jgi:hypothetical protein